MIFDDTIAAISTPLGIGAVGIVRISGKDSFKIADAVFKGNVIPSDAASHTIHYGFLVDPLSGEKIDTVLVGLMRAPKSYTGLDTVEFNCHGGPYNTKKVLEIILSQGARPAEPGEFTKLAYLNGKIDLSQAEAIADLIHAKTEGARKASMAQFMGNLKDEVSELRKQLIQLCSLLEIDLDFAEENLLAIDSSKINEQLSSVEKQIEKLLSTYQTGHIIRDGAKVTILGKPNVGKSSLLNSLLKKERAIVSNVPGTTRDYIEETLDINGIPFTFVDTAGIRDSTDDIEVHGIHFSKEAILSSDLIIVLFDASKMPDADDQKVMNIVNDAVSQNKSTRSLFVANKRDLGEMENFGNLLDTSEPLVKISAKLGAGIDDLKARICKLFQKEISFTSPMISRLRQKIALEKSLQSLSIAKSSLSQKLSYEFVALDIRNAISALAEIVGEVTTDEILENIFSKFCIGK